LRRRDNSWSNSTPEELTKQWNRFSLWPWALKA
jgi:hypothetical protein